MIALSLPGVRNAAAAARIIGKRGVLEFYDFEADLTGPSTNGLGTPVPKRSLFALLSNPKTLALARHGAPSRSYRLGSRVWRVPHDTVVVTCDNRKEICPVFAPPRVRTEYFLFKHIPGKAPEMTGKDLKLSDTHADVNQFGGPVVVIQFTAHGTKVFHEITRKEAQRGQLLGGECAQSPPPLVQHFAIVLDDEIESVPYIDYCKNPDGIPGDNGAEIDLGSGGSISEAKRLALVLRTGALPVQLVQIR